MRLNKRNVVAHTRLVLILTVSLLSCDDEYNAERLAEQYCECLRLNDGKNNFDKAGAICDAKLIAENRYYKLFAIDMRSSELDARISNATRDSVNEFTDLFERYINNHCCDYMFGCPQSNQEKGSPFVNTWTYVTPSNFFHATLDIKPDYTFAYHGGGCDTYSKSNGTWSFQNDSIILISTKPAECYRTIEFGANCFVVDSSSRVKTRQKKLCEYFNEETYVIFDREIFYLSSDTLSHKSNRTSECPWIKDLFVRKARPSYVN